MVGDGKLDSEELRDKYYLGDKKFKKLAPPDLTGMKLHMIEGLDLAGLVNRLLNIHR